MDMKKVLFALAMGFALTGCGTVYDTYDGYGYNDYAYGYGTEYVIINNGYSYGYNANVIDAITNRMILEMALDQARAARLLELNRRYFYIFHSMPNYSFGYYNFTPGPRPPRRNPVGPGYNGGPNRPPYGGGSYDNGRGYYGRGQGGYRTDYSVNMTDRELEAAAKEYTRSVRAIVGDQNYTKFDTKVRADAKVSNQKVNAVRANPYLDADRATTTNSTATRTRTSTNTNTNVNTNRNAVRSNGTTGTTTQQGTSTSTRNRVRSNSNSTGTTTQQSTGTSTRSRVRSNSNSNSTGTTTQQNTGNSTRTRVRSNSTSSSTNNTTTTTTSTNSTSTRTRTR